ncbi:MAG TPA: acyl-CoA dehydrogenase family protein [Trebonia sp.]|nr:acyl-CoA dehydrogenase family protein [Trebonia sp.]
MTDDLTPAAADDLAEARAELRAVARDLLATVNPATTAGWRRLADAGWLGLEAPSACNGADATFAEVAVILEELGRAAAPGPYLGSVALGIGALLELAPAPGRDDLLGRAAVGRARPVAVLSAGPDDHDDPPFLLEGTPGRLRLHGQAAFAPDATEADRLLLLAGAEGSGAAVVVIDVDPGVVGLTVAAQPVLDPTRRLARITADAVAVDQASVWAFDGDPSAAAGRLLDRAAVAIAGDSLGLSEAMLAATVAYAKVRHQFGRPIGSFQAVKHACADMLVSISVSRGLVDAAVHAIASGDPQAGVAASMAKSHACQAAVDIAGKAMQLHGGIGYTWESGIHRYLKRAALNRSLFGAPTTHRKRLAARYAEMSR